MDLLGFPIFALVLTVVVLAVIFAGVKTVPQGEKWTVERFGRYSRTLESGLSLIVPFIDRIGRKQNVMERVLDVPRQRIITRDNAAVEADGVVFYQIIDPSKAAYEVEDLQTSIVNITTTNLRSVLGSMDLDAVLSNRDKINDALLQTVDLATNPWGTKITRVEIRDVQPPEDMLRAMALQMTAERERRAVITKANGDREAAVLRAEGEKQAQILEAEGRKEAAFRDAEARERSAEAEAKATAMVSQAIAKGDLQAVNYFVAQRYVEALEKIGVSPTSKLVLMPLDAAGVTGSIGGISELLRHVGVGGGQRAAGGGGGQRAAGGGGG